MTWRALCNLLAWMRLTRRKALLHGPCPRHADAAARLPAWLALCLLTLLPAEHAQAAPEREISLSIAGGYRVYDKQLGLSDDAALLARVGLELSSRGGLAIEYMSSDPPRPAARSFSHVVHCVLLGHINALTGSTRPYVIFGTGILAVDYSDTPDVSAAVVSAGVGIERRVGRQLLLRAEAIAEFYRASVVSFDGGGRVTRHGPYTTEANGLFSAGLGFHF